MANITTVEDVVRAAEARVQEYSVIRPMVRSVLYRRISIRQQEIALLAARANKEFYGVAANALVVAGAIDVNDISSPVPGAEFIHQIEIGAVGVGALYAVGTQVSVVRLGDEKAEEPPRVTMRAGVIRQVGGDLVGVTSLKVYYSKIPDVLLAAENGTTIIAIPSPYEELLVLDLARYIVSRTYTGESADTGKAATLTQLDGEVKEWEAKWLAHVADYGMLRTRFDR